MQAAFALGLIVLSAVAGGFLARAKVAFLHRAIAYLSLWLVSLLVACIPYFLRDPSTWIETYASAAIFGGIRSFIVHVLPAVIVYHATRICLNRKKRSAA